MIVYPQAPILDHLYSSNRQQWRLILDSANGLYGIAGK